MRRHAIPDSSVKLLKRQLKETFSAARYPLCDPADLLSALANGRQVFVVDDVELVPLELALTASDSLSFPYDSPTDLVEDFVAPFHAGRRGRPV
jgi:hypothetical protein